MSGRSPSSMAESPWGALSYWKGTEIQMAEESGKQSAEPSPSLMQQNLKWRL